MGKIRELNLKELEEAKQIFIEVSRTGFLMNVLNSYKKGLINTKEKNKLCQKN